MKMKKGEKRINKKEKKKDMLIKKESQYSGAMARKGSCETLHFTRRWDPHQPVSSGFTAMTLW